MGFQFPSIRLQTPQVILESIHQAHPQARYGRDQGLGGIMFWTIIRHTLRRATLETKGWAASCSGLSSGTPLRRATLETKG